jgi:hypothetical protein
MVDTMNGNAATPTLAQLQPYDVVELDPYTTYQNTAGGMLNALADYVDGGGTVVMTNYAWVGGYLDGGNGGRFLTGGYSPWGYSPTYVGGPTQHLGAYNASSPLMQGVTTLDTKTPYAMVLASGATTVASTSAGTPLSLIAVKGHVVGINESLTSSGGGTWTGDYARLIVNAGNANGPQPTLSVAKAGNGTGTVTSSPAGINCGTTCAAQFPLHSSVTLTATPGSGSSFAGWTGSGCSGAGTCIVTMTPGPTVTASFVLNSPGGGPTTGGGGGPSAGGGAGPSAGGGAGPTAGGGGVPTVAPRLSSLSISPRKFFAARSGATIAIARKPGGATVSYTDSTAALTTFAVSHSAPGVRRGRRCIKPPRAHSPGTHRCKRTVVDGTFEHMDARGRVSFRFTGRLRGRALPPRTYELRGVARAAGRSSQPVTALFTIKH